MSIAARPCTCDGVLGLPGQSCPIHGSKYTRMELDMLREANKRLVAENDRAMRLFNRLDAAISHHREANGFVDTHDEALYHAQKKVYADTAEGKG